MPCCRSFRHRVRLKAETYSPHTMLQMTFHHSMAARHAKVSSCCTWTPLTKSSIGQWMRWRQLPLRSQKRTAIIKMRPLDSRSKCHIRITSMVDPHDRRQMASETLKHQILPTATAQPATIRRAITSKRRESLRRAQHRLSLPLKQPYAILRFTCLAWSMMRVFSDRI